jgi:putative aldouronate transport system substrate-binding protein
MIAENADYAVTNVAQSLTSATFDARWTEFAQAANDAYTKYMVGELDMDGYQAAIDKIRAGGLGQIEQEFTDSYNELNK